MPAAQRIPRDKAARDRVSYKPEDLLLCALRKHSPSLTARDGTQNPACVLRPALKSHMQRPCPCPAHTRSFHSSRFPLGESDVSQRMAAALKAQVEPGSDLGWISCVARACPVPRVSTGVHTPACAGPDPHPPAGPAALRASSWHWALCGSSAGASRVPAAPPAAQPGPERAGNSSGATASLPVPPCATLLPLRSRLGHPGHGAGSPAATGTHSWDTRVCPVCRGC